MTWTTRLRGQKRIAKDLHAAIEKVKRFCHELDIPETIILQAPEDRIKRLDSMIQIHRASAERMAKELELLKPKAKSAVAGGR
jgi:hypothetical protein